MNEDFLQFVWRFRLFNQKNLLTSSGETLEIHHPGLLNSNSGPDFYDSRIRINNTLWAGNVEIHLRSSDWVRHQHHNDRAYDNVILHVVYVHDKEIQLSSSKAPIPVLELKDRIDYQVIRRFKAFQASKTWIPCEENLENVPQIVWSAVKTRMAVERLQQRYQDIQLWLRESGNDIKQVYFRFLLRYFGFKTNTLAFEQLGKILPYSLLMKHRLHNLQLEALIFGQAGFLEGPTADNYHGRLQEEYRFLQNKYKLIPMHESVWKFARLRPANFPTIRLAQIAGWFSTGADLVQEMMGCKKLADVKRVLRLAIPSPYWMEHFHFGKSSGRRNSGLGEQSIDGLIINAAAPLSFAIGQMNNDLSLVEDAQEWWRELPSEENIITRKWRELGIQALHAGDSQGLLFLKNEWCSAKKCLTCPVGHHIFNSQVNEEVN